MIEPHLIRHPPPNKAMQLTTALLSLLPTRASSNTLLLHCVPVAARAVASDCPNR